MGLVANLCIPKYNLYYAGRKSQKPNNTPTTGVPYPVSINVLPAQTAHASTAAASPWLSSPNENPVIPEPREAAVREYCKWLESRASDKAYKADFQSICEVTLENHLDLELILEDPDPDFFIKQGIKMGTARRFIRDIYQWATHTERNFSYGECIEEIFEDVAE